ncbi:Gfo/Idh/MocA family protein [Haloarchaeobius sp. TZWSO28]|uniref:Gfo/Idh/MocA family protein n=1 Tax=Haloarchaeobius sp. TZWSO28 TaxID=3446119 RepID=UPI003EBE2779
MSSLQVGFVGAGSIAYHHADAIESLGETVAAVADVNPDALATFAASYDVTETYNDYERMFVETDLDAAIVAVPNSFHADCAVAALEADVNVLVEKPLADSVAAAERVESAARESDADVMVGFKKAFNPWFEHARRKAETGAFGEVYDVESEYIRQRGIPQLGSWFTQKSVAGGGAMIDIGVHQLHLVLCLLDFPEVRTVSATTGSHFGTREDYTYLDMWGGDPVADATFDVDDFTRAFIRTADGTTIHLHVAWASNSDPRQCIRVHGGEAGLNVTESDDEVSELFSTDDGALTRTAFQHPEADTFVAEWSYFTAVIRGTRPHTRNTLEEGLAVQRVVEAIYESADSNREVRLDG